MAIGDDFELGPKWTEQVVSSMGPKTNPRMRTLMASLIRHIHDFARENELTVDEWMSAVQLINEAGKWSDDRRNEGQLLCDIIGLESYVYSLLRSSPFWTSLVSCCMAISHTGIHPTKLPALGSSTL